MQCRGQIAPIGRCSSSTQTVAVRQTVVVLFKRRCVPLHMLALVQELCFFDPPACPAGPTNPTPTPCEHPPPPQLSHSKSVVITVRDNVSEPAFLSRCLALSLEKPPLIDAHSSLSARTNGEYGVAAGVLSMEGIVRLQRPFDLGQMRSEIAAALGSITRKRFDLCSLPSKWLTLEQAVADAQSLGPHKLRWTGLAKTIVVVARDVAGEDAVLEAIIAPRCADEHTDDHMRSMQLRDCETTTFCPTHCQAPLPKTRTYPTPRCAKIGPREGSLCVRHVCEHFPLSQLRFCAARFRLLNMKVSRVFVRSGDPSPCRPIPQEQVQLNNAQHAVCDSSCLCRALSVADTSDIRCPRCACICNARKRPIWVGTCSRHCASSRIFGTGTVVA